MESRLVQLLQAEGINPTRFAERIGVQRSSISHILSGRNKPSYDFIIKILDSFPSLNPDWLLRGKGLMYKNDIHVQPSLFDPVINTKKETDIHEAESEISQIDKSNEVKSAENPIISPEILTEIHGGTPKIAGKRIEKVLIFYTDKTFSDYHPNT